MTPSFPKLVLLPGMDGTGLLFENFVAALPHDFVAYAIAYPNDRPLTSSELAEVVEEQLQSFEPFVLIAESFSTLVAVEYAAKMPPNLRGIVICAGFVTSPLRGWKRFSILLAKRFLFALQPTNAALKYLLAGRDAPLVLLNLLRNAISSVSSNVLTARLAVVLDADRRAELRSINVPILYLRPKQDRLVDHRCVDEIKGANPSLVVELVDGPHLLLQREPYQTADLITRFVRQLHN